MLISSKANSCVLKLLQQLMWIMQLVCLMILYYRAGVSLKIEVASRFKNSNWRCEQGNVSPHSLGGSWGVLLQKILKFQSSSVWFPAFLGLNWVPKRVCFSTKENVAFVLVLSASQSTPTSNNQMMITWLLTLAHEQTLRKTYKRTCVNINFADWNIAFT